VKIKAHNSEDKQIVSIYKPRIFEYEIKKTCTGDAIARQISGIGIQNERNFARSMMRENAAVERQDRAGKGGVKGGAGARAGATTNRGDNED